MTVTSPIMRYHGGKFRLAPWIMSFFPDHKTYVEPFGGAAGVLLQKPRSQSEVYNDLDGEIVNVFETLRDPEASARLQELLVLTPYSRSEFEHSYQPTDDPIEQARRTLVRAHMGFGSAGATKGITGFRIDSAREYGTASHLWARYPEQIATFCKRLNDVIIENRPAAKVIENHDREDTLFFVDPPYRHDTRDSRSYDAYRHELTDDDHSELLQLLSSAEGMVILSGYDSDQYNDILKGWDKHTKKARISAGRGTGTRLECVWLNPQCAEQQRQGKLI